MIKYLIWVFLLFSTVAAQEYNGEFINGIRTETFSFVNKMYIGPPFYDSILHNNCELLDSIIGGTISLAWTAVGDDSLEGTASLYEIKYDSTQALLYNLVIPNPKPSGEPEFITLMLDPKTKYYFAIRTKDDENNWSELSEIISGVTSPILYKQIAYYIDTSFLVIKTYPDSVALPDSIYQTNESGLDFSYTESFKTKITFHISAMRRKDVSMNDFVDLTDLSGMILYLTAGTPFASAGSMDTTQPLADKEILKNYPNPFNQSTKITYKVKEKSNIKIAIYDILGRHVITLVDEVKDVGNYTAEWAGKSEYNNFVSSGVYFYRLENGNAIITKKMVLLK